MQGKVSVTVKSFNFVCTKVCGPINDIFVDIWLRGFANIHENTKLKTCCYNLKLVDCLIHEIHYICKVPSGENTADVIVRRPYWNGGDNPNVKV